MKSFPLTLALNVALLSAGCAGTPPARDSIPVSVAIPAHARSPDLMPYLRALEAMAPGDAARQQATLDETRAAMEADPSSANRLRHALAVGAAGPVGSNPVESRRMLHDLLAGPNQLSPEEHLLASSFLREFEARVTLYAELARQREEQQAQLAAAGASAEHRAAALATENARLRKALAEADRKLQAVAEMERQLLEQGTSESGTAPATQR
jgi:hypothetical protein